MVEYALNAGIEPSRIDSDELICKLTYPEDLPYLLNLIHSHNINPNLNILNN